MDLPQEKQVKSGVVALVGPPNVGKSTLLNALLGQKISIVSPKPQTTRNRILGIVNGTDHQIVLLDTPGIHEARSPLNQEMVRIAVESLAEVDVIVFMIDTTFPAPARIGRAAAHLVAAGKPALLLINKTDLVAPEELLPVLAAYQDLYPFAAMIPISARQGDGTDILLGELLRLLPEGPRLYPEDIPTDATERFIAAELIREKIFLHTTQEVPYSCAVTVDSFREETRKIVIDATIYVEKNSQKGIIIGKGGAMLKKIGRSARLDLQELLGVPVTLQLWVKVQKDWTRDARFLRQLGLGE
ncbi:MAG: GTPase Era [Thermodesulfobacteriota bacterium]